MQMQMLIAAHLPYLSFAFHHTLKANVLGLPSIKLAKMLVRM
jgi:hypothetical protein